MRYRTFSTYCQGFYFIVRKGFEMTHYVYGDIVNEDFCKNKFSDDTIAAVTFMNLFSLLNTCPSHYDNVQANDRNKK